MEPYNSLKLAYLLRDEGIDTEDLITAILFEHPAEQQLAFHAVCKYEDRKVPPSDELGGLIGEFKASFPFDFSLI
jgi:hypothetical protein